VVAGSSVAYEVAGAGPDVVEICGGLLWEEHPLTRAWPERVREFARLTSYDTLGEGRSDPLAPGVVPTLDDKVAEALAVMDAAAVDAAVLIGWFASAPIALGVAAVAPGRVRGLVVVNGYARLVEDTDFPAGVPRAVREEFERTIAERHGTGFMVRRWLPEVAEHPEVQAFMERYEQAVSSRGQVAAIAMATSQFDARDRLAAVRAPITVIHARDDHVVPVALGRDLHERLPGSRYLEVATSNHLFALPPLLDVVIDETRAMSTGNRGLISSTTLTALVITDIVASTERLSALRDETWAALLAEYQQRAAETITRFSGRRVNTTGDGVLATYDSAISAIRCAAALSHMSTELGIVSRAGVHVGDVENLDDDITGLSVHITARLLDHAPRGGIVISEAAAQAAIGAGLSLREIARAELRGVRGKWRLYQLDT
jgi:class 3 adenylate cyclase/pimeloyl-ACP methyl ester carboxylesterase